ncbi:MAG TPA: class I SAM-dependent methyltransferase [Streptosporangiaceae bacterium]|nr:class I SAM-dependent methyltransferase [Streptosporangiaceae bacterium]
MSHESIEGDERPSNTALTAAAARAAHLVVDNEPAIFVDSMASTLLGDRADELIGFHRAHGTHPVLAGTRAEVTCGSRYTEDRLAHCLDRGVTQYVILGAGLDSFAYRSDLAGHVRIFEVDHSSTQRWKRGRLRTAQIAVPSMVAFVAVDFEADSLADRFIRTGFDPARPAFVSWLGVTMYLTRAAIGETLAVIGAFAPDTELVADYILPACMRDVAGNAYVELVAPAAAKRGEPWQTFLTPGEMSAWSSSRASGRSSTSGSVARPAP